MLTANDDAGILIDVVLGAPSGDLESVVSTLLLAYYHASTCYKLVRKESARYVFPVLPMQSQDFSINGDVIDLLRRCKVNFEDLIFFDQLDWENIQVGRVHLCNHNTLSAGTEFLTKKIYSIIDNQTDAGLYQEMVANSRRTIEATAGSCCSLIAELYIFHEDLFFSRSNADSSDLPGMVLAKLLFSAIVFSTSNLMKKKASVDIQMIDYFENKFDLNGKQTLKIMQEAKKKVEFWESLSTWDKLRCNYIQDGLLGISFVRLPLDDFLNADNPNNGNFDPAVGFHEYVTENGASQNVKHVLYDSESFVNQAHAFMQWNKIQSLFVVNIDKADISEISQVELKSTLSIASIDENRFDSFLKACKLNNKETNKLRWGGDLVENIHTGEDDLIGDFTIYMQSFKVGSIDAEFASITEFFK